MIVSAAAQCSATRGYDQDPHVQQLTIAFPGSDGGEPKTVAGVQLDAACRDFRLDDVTLASPTVAPAPVKASLTITSIAQAGQAISYDVTLTNSAATAYTFGADCPVFTETDNQAQDIVEASFVLPCDPGTTIPAGSDRQYSFTTSIPARYHQDAMRFGWRLDGGIAANAVIQLRPS